MQFENRTALSFAAALGHAACVRLLLDGGADKDAKAEVLDLILSADIWIKIIQRYSLCSFDVFSAGDLQK